MLCASNREQIYRGHEAHHGHDIYHGHDKIGVERKEMTALHRNAASKQFEPILTGVLRKAGLKVKRHATANPGPDIVFEKEGQEYVLEMKASSEGRSDRLIPLLSQAILQARTYAEESGRAIPIAIVAAPRIPVSVAGQIRDFAQRYASEVGVGMIDAEGFRSFIGFGLEALDAKPSRHPASEVSRARRLPHLFSDLNQWMLKILIGQHLPATHISIPRGPIRNASQLANLAGVSVISASRFVKNLSERGFLDRRDDLLRIVRLQELLDLWISANRDERDEIPARWIIKKGPDQLKSVLGDYAAPHPSKSLTKDTPKCCLALFAAADALGYGFVHGATPHIYLESVTLGALHRLGLVLDHTNRAADVYIRKPSNTRAIFKPVVMRDKIPVSDILQVWLDVSTHPARGREQAREIWRHALKKFLD